MSEYEERDAQIWNEAPPRDGIDQYAREADPFYAQPETRRMIVAIEEQRHGYVELEADPFESEDHLKRRAVELIRDGDLRPTWDSGARWGARAAWAKGTRCVAGEPTNGHIVGLRPCLTHDGMMRGGTDYCHERWYASNVAGVEDPIR